MLLAEWLGQRQLQDPCRMDLRWVAHCTWAAFGRALGAAAASQTLDLCLLVLVPRCDVVIVFVSPACKKDWCPSMPGSLAPNRGTPIIRTYL